MNGKRSRIAIGLLDFLIGIIIILIIVVAVKLSITSKGAQEVQPDMDNISFTVELQKVTKEFGEGITVGQKVYDALKGGFLGYVSGVEVIPYMGVSYNPQSGMIEENPIEGLYCANVSIKAQGEVLSNTTMVSGVKVTIGREFFLKGQSFAGKGYIIKLEQKEVAK